MGEARRRGTHQNRVEQAQQRRAEEDAAEKAAAVERHRRRAELMAMPAQPKAKPVMLTRGSKMLSLMVPAMVALSTPPRGKDRQ